MCDKIIVILAIECKICIFCFSLKSLLLSVIRTLSLAVRVLIMINLPNDLSGLFNVTAQYIIVTQIQSLSTMVTNVIPVKLVGKFLCDFNPPKEKVWWNTLWNWFIQAVCCVNIYNKHFSERILWWNLKVLLYSYRNLKRTYSVPRYWSVEMGKKYEFLWIIIIVFSYFNDCDLLNFIVKWGKIIVQAIICLFVIESLSSPHHYKTYIGIIIKICLLTAEGNINNRRQININ